MHHFRLLSYLAFSVFLFLFCLLFQLLLLLLLGYWEWGRNRQRPNLVWKVSQSLRQNLHLPLTFRWAIMQGLNKVWDIRFWPLVFSPSEPKMSGLAKMIMALNLFIFYTLPNIPLLAVPNTRCPSLYIIIYCTIVIGRLFGKRYDN